MWGFLVAGVGIVMVLVGLPLGFGDAASAVTNIVVGVGVMGVLLLPSSQVALGYLYGSEAEPAPSKSEPLLPGVPDGTVPLADAVARDASAADASAAGANAPGPRDASAAGANAPGA